MATQVTTDAEEPEDKKPEDQKPDDPNARKPILPGVRARLQKLYTHAMQVASRGQADYAIDLLSGCLREDPGNLTYVQSYLNILYKKWNNNKKGSKMAGLSTMGIQGTVKKCQMRKDWDGVLKSGLEMLKVNPWHVETLLSMGNAAEQLHLEDVQLAWLKGALDFDMKDAKVNKACAMALGRQGQFDQAIACWHRVEQAKPGDEESQRAISALSVERTINKTISDEQKAEEQLQADVQARDAQEGGAINAAKTVTPEQRWRKAIADNPADVQNYIELAELLGRDNRTADAEKVLVKGLEASGGDIKVRELLEDARVRSARTQLEVAEKQAHAQKTQPANDLYKKMKSELLNVEIDVFRARCDRYPSNTNFKIELGIRLKRAKNFDEAIKALQGARNDPKRKGAVLLELGECFQNIKQYSLALNNYESAIESLTEREEDAKKRALYNAGKLAKALSESKNGAPELRDVARKHFTELAGLDFSYKDVADLLKELRN